MNPAIKIIGLNRMRRAESTLRNLHIMPASATWIHAFLASGGWRADEDTAFLSLHDPLERCLFQLWQNVFCLEIWRDALVRVRNWIAKCYPDEVGRMERARRPPSCFRVGSEGERRRLWARGIDVDAYLADWERRFGAVAPKVEQQEVKTVSLTRNILGEKPVVLDTLTPVVSSRAVQTDPLTLEQVIGLLKRCNERCGNNGLKMA
ncbi:hypothetical protein IQ07DRAFT_221495 [Pyrenochaeta sp. DS3sAY3a]|nr:hypothetical protein IQ07DRAFT_221495 [Pyrenochaeta sp. DS3sAY3a]